MLNKIHGRGIWLRQETAGYLVIANCLIKSEREGFWGRSNSMLVVVVDLDIDTESRFDACRDVHREIRDGTSRKDFLLGETKLEGGLKPGIGGKLCA